LYRSSSISVYLPPPPPRSPLFPYTTLFRSHTHSAVWSCLAAHAALLHIDGIGRRALSDKRFGVFDCARLSGHPLTAGVPSRLRRSEEHTSELQSRVDLVCRLLLEKKNTEDR